MAHLCALKRTTDFTEMQMTVWYGGLSSFPAWIINRSVLKLATSTERFPEFGDLYQLCRREATKAGVVTEPYSPNGSGEKISVTTEEIMTLGDSLGLVVRSK